MVSPIEKSGTAVGTGVKTAVETLVETGTAGRSRVSEMIWFGFGAVTEIKS